MKMDDGVKPRKMYIIDGTYYVCPVCGEILFDQNDLKHETLKKLSIKSNLFCGHCGCKFDWGDEDE